MKTFVVLCEYPHCSRLGCDLLQEPDGGSMKGLAFAWDPDGYPIEIIKRGGIEFGDKRVES